MILTCPQCDTRFVVPSTIFMRGGRKLKCSTCKHSWFQEEPLEKNNEVNAPPQIDEPSDHNHQGNASFIDKIKNDFKQGRVLIGSICAVVMLSFFIYQMMTPPLITGQGLAFDNVTIERDGMSLIVNGDIVNAMDSDRGVPSIKVTRILTNDIEGDATIISPDKNILGSGESLSISTTFDNVGPEVVNVKLGFNLSQGKSEGMNPEPHSAHQAN